MACATALTTGPHSFTWSGQFYVPGARCGAPGTHFSSTAQLPWLHGVAGTRKPPSKRPGRPALTARCPTPRHSHHSTTRPPRHFELPAAPPPAPARCRLQGRWGPSRGRYRGGVRPRRLSWRTPWPAGRCCAGGGGGAVVAAGTAAALGLPGRGRSRRRRRWICRGALRTSALTRTSSWRWAGAAEGRCGPGGGLLRSGVVGSLGRWEGPGALGRDLLSSTVGFFFAREKRWACHWKGRGSGPFAKPGGLHLGGCVQAGAASEPGEAEPESERRGRPARGESRRVFNRGIRVPLSRAGAGCCSSPPRAGPSHSSSKSSSACFGAKLQVDWEAAFRPRCLERLK